MKRLTGLEALLFVLTILLVFLMAARTPLESDLWWHLRAGQTTWETGRPLLSDVFSYTRQGAAWVNHSWLAQVLFYGAYSWGGYLALGVLVALFATISMVFVYLQMEGPGLLRAFVTVLAALMAAWVWSARPQVISLAMFAALAYVLYLYQWRGIDRLWLVPVIMLVWSNLHGGYVLGGMLLFTTLGGELLNHALCWEDAEPMPWRKLWRLFLWSALAGVAVLVNPNGLDTWLIPFQTVGVKALQQFISEWASPDFHDVAQQPMLWMMLGLLMAVGLSRRRLDGVDLLNVVVFGYAAFVARRNFGPFALVSAPVLSRHLWPMLSGWWQRLAKLRQRLPFGDRLGTQKDLPLVVSKTINLMIVALIALVAFVKLYVVTQPSLVDAYLRAGSPVGAVNWIAEHHPQGRLFNSYNWGGYLIWALPEYPVFVDGRTDLYGDEIIGEWMRIVQADEGWQERLAHWQVNLILIEPDRPLVQALSEAGWVVLYQDEMSVVYGR